MGISFTDFSGGASKANDFTINTGSSGNNVFSLDRTYDSGSYLVTATSGDTSFDIYAVTSAGEYCGYSNTAKIDVTDKFNKLVILGLPNNDQVFFTYRGKINAPAAAGSVPAAGAYVSSVSVSSLEDIDDTTTITGGNFANDVEVYFIGQSNTETAAKNIVVTSVNQLIVTRPDSFDPSDSPYTIKVVNPGIPTPDGSNLFRLNNSVTAGTIPSWTTGSLVYYQLSANTAIDLVAADIEISDIDYSLVSGTLPSGLSLDAATGSISGTFSGSANDGDSSSLILRATDAGGNFVDKEISFVANGAPSWNVASGPLQDAPVSASYSVSISASPGAANPTVTYSIVSGSLPNGLSMDSSGNFSGTATTEESSTFTVRAEDQFGNFSDREFSITAATTQFDVEYLVIAGGGGGGGSEASNGSGGGGAGGGAGGYRSSVSGENTGGGLTAEVPFQADIGVQYSVSIGGGGAGGGVAYFNGTAGSGAKGTDSSFAGIISTGGGAGGGEEDNGPGVGGSGGGRGGDSSGSGASGTAGQGFSGGPGRQLNNTGRSGGGGGGAGQAATTRVGGNGVQSSITGTATYRAGGGGGGGGGADSQDAAGGLGGGGTGSRAHGSGQSTFGGNTGTNGDPNTGGGGGAAAAGYNGSGRTGGSGVVILRYPSSRTLNVGAGLSANAPITVGASSVSVITAGSGNVSFS